MTDTYAWLLVSMITSLAVPGLAVLAISGVAYLRFKIRKD